MLSNSKNIFIVDKNYSGWKNTHYFNIYRSKS